ncbi:MAG: hypothetical protein IJQ98_12680 [Oscillospiraceae bacterium]|nr:hypothetical protein [Oscillospiraceae bacterium]
MEAIALIGTSFVLLSLYRGFAWAEERCAKNDSADENRDFFFSSAFHAHSLLLFGNPNNTESHATSLLKHR